MAHYPRLVNRLRPSVLAVNINRFVPNGYKSGTRFDGLIKERQKWQISIKLCNIKIIHTLLCSYTDICGALFYCYFVTKLINEVIHLFRLLLENFYYTLKL